MVRPKILVLDIETRPALGYFWGLFDQNIGLEQLIEPSAPISFAGKYVGEDEVFFYSDWTDGHVEMIRKIHKLISESDAVVGYNNDSFDLRKLQGEFLLAGLAPPPPTTSIDLLKTMKKLGFQSNKLAYIGPFLGVGKKMKHEGFSLWLKCLKNDPKAQNKMRRYNIQDVFVTEKLYKKILPYITNHPHLGDDKKECGSCNSNKVHSRGFRRTKSFKIQRLQCQDCGAWQDGKRTKV